MKHSDVTPYLVFDNEFLPSKVSTELVQAKYRKESMKSGFELFNTNKTSQTYEELQKATDVTLEMVWHLIEELKKDGVYCVIAPYEADI